MLGSGCLFNEAVATLECIPVVFRSFVSVAWTLAGAIAIIIIIVSGIKFLISGGDAKKVDSAKKSLTYAVIGLILILSAYFIVSVIGQVTGVGCIVNFGFNTCQ